MSLIIGTEYCTLDSNGRFKFPIALKKQLGTEDGRFVVRKSFDVDCLELWTYESFQREVERLQARLNPYNMKDRAILRHLNMGNIIELDNNDRLLIPSEQKATVAKSKKIVLQSIGSYIEIWDYDKYQAMNAEVSDFAQMVNDRLGCDPDKGEE